MLRALRRCGAGLPGRSSPSRGGRSRAPRSARRRARRARVPSSQSTNARALSGGWPLYEAVTITTAPSRGRCPAYSSSGATLRRVAARGRIARDALGEVLATSRCSSRRARAAASPCGACVTGAGARAPRAAPRTAAVDARALRADREALGLERERLLDLELVAVRTRSGRSASSSEASTSVASCIANTRPMHRALPVAERLPRVRGDRLDAASGAKRSGSNALGVASTPPDRDAASGMSTSTTSPGLTAMSPPSASSVLRRRAERRRGRPQPQRLVEALLDVAQLREVLELRHARHRRRSTRSTSARAFAITSGFCSSR